MSQADPDLITDTPSSRSDENTTAATGETSQTASQSVRQTNASTREATKGGWYQLDGVPEIREMIFKEYLGELHDEVREPSLRLNAADHDDHNAMRLVSCLNVLHVCKGFDNEVLPLLRRCVGPVARWVFWPEGQMTWDETSQMLANLNRIVSSSVYYGFRFDRYVLDFETDGPMGYETGGFSAALAKHMRLSGVDGVHDFDQKFKTWCLKWRGQAKDEDARTCFAYENTGLFVSIYYHGRRRRRDDDVAITIHCDVVKMDFRKFDWKPTKLGEYGGWA